LTNDGLIPHQHQNSPGWCRTQTADADCAPFTLLVPKRVFEALLVIAIMYPIMGDGFVDENFCFQKYKGKY
jgi:hypothetical protein